MTAFIKSGGPKGESVSPDPFPDVKWVSLHRGTRSHGELEDRAARFLEKDNIIEANADFQGFQDVLNFFMDEWKHMPEAAELIRDLVLKEYEMLMTEIVAGALSFKGRRHWDHDQYMTAVSEEALTSAVMARLYPMQAIQRQLTSTLGKPGKECDIAA